MRIQKNKGLTLIELMVTLVILGIVAAVAVPGYQSLINHNRLTSASNQLLSSVATARSEALKLKEAVTITPKSNDWTKGWVVTVGTGSSQKTIFSQDKLDDSLNLSSTSSTNAVVFGANGYTSSLNPWSGSGVVFCNKDKSGRKISLQRSGSTKILKVTCS